MSNYTLYDKIAKYVNGNKGLYVLCLSASSAAISLLLDLNIVFLLAPFLTMYLIVVWEGEEREDLVFWFGHFFVYYILSDIMIFFDETYRASLIVNAIVLLVVSVILIYRIIDFLICPRWSYKLGWIERWILKKWIQSIRIIGFKVDYDDYCHFFDENSRNKDNEDD